MRSNGRRPAPQWSGRPSDDRLAADHVDDSGSGRSEQGGLVLREHRVGGKFVCLERVPSASNTPRLPTTLEAALEEIHRLSLYNAELRHENAEHRRKRQAAEQELIALRRGVGSGHA